MAKIICGVDVSSKTLDARIGEDGPSQSFDRTPEGIRALAAFCKSHDVEFVVVPLQLLVVLARPKAQGPKVHTKANSTH